MCVFVWGAIFIAIFDMKKLLQDTTTGPPAGMGLNVIPLPHGILGTVVCRMIVKLA